MVGRNVKTWVAPIVPNCRQLSYVDTVSFPTRSFIQVWCNGSYWTNGIGPDLRVEPVQDDTLLDSTHKVIRQGCQAEKPVISVLTLHNLSGASGDYRVSTHVAKSIAS